MIKAPERQKVTIEVQCEDCGHVQTVMGTRVNGDHYFGSGYDFCNVCDGKPHYIQDSLKEVQNA